MNNFRWPEWREGDLVECDTSYAGQFTKGQTYELESTPRSNRVSVKQDDNGERNGWSLGHFRFHSRPKRGPQLDHEYKYTKIDSARQKYYRCTVVGFYGGDPVIRTETGRFYCRPVSEYHYLHLNGEEL